jgi:hypothetical protein
VSVTWSIVIVDPGQNTGGRCGDAMRTNRFPTQGSFAGNLVFLGAAAYDIILTSWSVSPCLTASPPPTSARYDALRRAIGMPLGRCPPSNLFGSMGIGGIKIGP